MDDANLGTETAPTKAELAALLQQAMGRDQSCLPELCRAFDEHPELVDQLGDLVQIIQNSLIALSEARVVGQEAIRRKATELRAELRATAMTPLEELLADRVSLCWIDVLTADLDLANRRKAEPGDTPAVRAADLRVDTAQARFLKATKALATAQKQLRPGPTVLDFLGGKSNGTRSNGTGDRRAEFNPKVHGTPAAN